MLNHIFQPCKILLPKNVDMHLWSVIACDQYSSRPDYWEAREAEIQSAPSTLSLMLPEVYLDDEERNRPELISEAMNEYLGNGVFAEYGPCFIYVERTLNNGSVRRGIVGAVDLEAYSYAKDSNSPIRATEATIPERLPPRVAIRRQAALEMPHIMVFANDINHYLIDTAQSLKPDCRKAYDFDLTGVGGHICGWFIEGVNTARMNAAIGRLEDDAAKSGQSMIYAMGDGNHSLATAKLSWEMLKAEINETELASHPARYALVEMIDIYDEAVTFEPIHRVVFNTNTNGIFEKASEYYCADFSGSSCSDGENGHIVSIRANGTECTAVISGETLGNLISKTDVFCSELLKQGGTVDYIHDDEEARRFADKQGSVAVLLPKMKKSELFSSVMQSGPFPKKSFSIGHADDKRYYLECRKILPES